MSFPPGVSWPPLQGIDSSGRKGRNRAGIGSRVVGTGVGIRQKLRTKSDFELDLPVSS